ncbi:restriction endonuclease subunit S, partial [Planktothrix sp.]|uniref:restriction endonuclease subunit S n=1 Tax=Planktothrix sp. TaxID=3088171 RepID=UPI0038D42003
MILNDICTHIVDCEHKTAPTQETGIPSIRTTDIKQGVIDFKKANKVSEETYKIWTQRLEPQPYDLILAREAPVGQVGIIPDGYRVCLGQRTVLIRPNPKKVDSYYLLYLLLSPQIQHEIRIRASGTIIEHLNMSDIRQLKLPSLPSLEIQHEIGRTLSSLERKIDNLRRQNETLETIAQTLFKHWFIDFEFPNDDGKPYKSSGGAMVASELGDIPAGWRVGKIEEIAKRIGMGPFGSRITTDNFVDNGIPVIRGNNLTNGFNEDGFVYLTPEKADELKSSNVFPEDLVFTHRGTLGQVGFIPTSSQYPRYVVSQSQMFLSVNKSLMSPRFIYRFFCSKPGLNALL